MPTQVISAVIIGLALVAGAIRGDDVTETQPKRSVDASCVCHGQQIEMKCGPEQIGFGLGSMISATSHSRSVMSGKRSVSWKRGGCHSVIDATDAAA